MKGKSQKVHKRGKSQEVHVHVKCLSQQIFSIIVPIAPNLKTKNVVQASCRLGKNFQSVKISRQLANNVNLNVFSLK